MNRLIENNSRNLTDRITAAVADNWMQILTLSMSIYVVLPFLAPFFKRIGWDLMANSIYFLYSFVCHQYPQRSFFFYGQSNSYTLETIQLWQDTSNPLTLGRFIGNSELGWKVAWSDRMVAMYSSIPILSWFWYPFRNKIKALPLGGFFLFLLPMGIDGISHMISDLAGLGTGFRSSNIWLVNLTGNAFRSEFYAGTQLGSFNSSMRIMSGILFGIGVVWFFFPHLDLLFRKTKKFLDMKQSELELEIK
jgi:uncharacterized membrane protein